MQISWVTWVLVLATTLCHSEAYKSLLLGSRLLWWNLRFDFFVMDMDRKGWSEILMLSQVPYFLCSSYDDEFHVIMFVFCVSVVILAPPPCHQFFTWLCSPVLCLVLIIFSIYILLCQCLFVKTYHALLSLCPSIVFLCLRYFLIPYFLALDPCIFT